MESVKKDRILGFNYTTHYSCTRSFYPCNFRSDRRITSWLDWVVKINMNILEIIIVIVACVFTVSWIFGIRKYVASGQGITKQTVNTTMLFVLSIAVVLFLKWSPLLLFVLFPVSWLLGVMSLAFPFSILWILGRYFALLFTIGVKPKK